MICSNSRQNIHKVACKEVYYENYIAARLAYANGLAVLGVTSLK